MAQREAYSAPSQAQNPLGTTSTYNSTTFTAVDQAGPLTQYLCGECSSKVQLKKGDPLRCKECGHRVLYKERTKRMVQFEAR